jgi:hypothetical protein
MPDWLLFILIAWAVLVGVGLIFAALRFVFRLARSSLYRVSGQARRDEERYWEIQREVSKSQRARMARTVEEMKEEAARRRTQDH